MAEALNHAYLTAFIWKWKGLIIKPMLNNITFKKRKIGYFPELFIGTTADIILNNIRLK